MRVLFIPDYAEPLIALLPLVRAVRERGHKPDILCWSRVEGDKDRIPKILAQYGDTAQYIETPDSSFSGLLGYLFPKIPQYSVIQLTLQQKCMRKLASHKLTEFSPDVLVVTNEHLPMLAYFIDIATQRRIPSICYLSFSGAFSERKLREQYNRLIDAKTQKGPHRTLRPGPFPPQRGFAKKIFMWVVEMGLHTYRALYHLDITFLTPYWGGGNATCLTAIGKGSRATFIELGVNPKKLRITGFPLYEDLYHKAQQNNYKINPDLRIQLGLPLDKPLFLWCTNDQLSYYQHLYSYEEMLASWKSIRDVLLRVNPKWHLVIKLHPKESKDDYWPVVCDEPRVTLIEDCDVWELIAECDFLLTRFSSTATSAICLGKSVLTHNYPKVPGGVLFEDIGGTFHANTLEELETFARGIAYNSDMQIEAMRRREEFIKSQIDIQDRPAAERFVDLLEEMTTC